METFLKVVLVLVMAAALLLVAGTLIAAPVMLIWNWMIPDLFGLPELGFWQSFWGCIMVKLIFGTGISTSTETK